MSEGIVTVIFVNGGLFPLGQCCITPGASASLESISVLPVTLLRRHHCGDWGELCEEDKATNQEAIKDGFRVFSSYELTSTVRVWVITEADRSSTTILLPSEY